MTSAATRRCSTKRATRAWLASCGALVALVGATTARAESERVFVITPVECAPYYELRGDSQPGWNGWLSFAACSQDATVGDVEAVEQLPVLVEDLQASLLPTLELYLAAVKRGPEPVKIRAGFQMAMAEVALITRARSSIKVPDAWAAPNAVTGFEALHARLEPLLEESALLAWTLFVAIDVTVTEKPSLAPDVVTRNMARMARERAAELGASWSFPRTEKPPLVAEPR